jgi:hypothetical protein
VVRFAFALVDAVQLSPSHTISEYVLIGRGTAGPGWARVRSRGDVPENPGERGDSGQAQQDDGDVPRGGRDLGPFPV